MPAAFGLPWYGGGPWKIEDDCPASFHNTLMAARGRRFTNHSGPATKHPKCICPRARLAVKRENKQRAARTKLSREIPKKIIDGPGPKVSTGYAGQWLPDGVSTPNWERAECAKHPHGVEIMDKAIETIGNARRVVENAKALCEVCPLRRGDCLEYVTRGEGSRPGIWPGVWAGMSPRERREIKA